MPLSRQAVDLLKQIKALTGESVFVFPSVRALDKPMSENTINKALRVIGYDTKTEVCLNLFSSLRPDARQSRYIQLKNHCRFHSIATNFSFIQ